MARASGKRGSKTRRTSARVKTGRGMKGAKFAARENELARIEDALGEEFETLAQARKALHRETGAVPFKDSYTVRELSTRKHRTVKTLLPEWESRAAEIDALKHKPDFWAAEIYGNKTYSLYGTFEQLVKKLSTYHGLRDEDPTKALANIKIVRVHGVNAVQDYYRQKKAEREAALRKTQAKRSELLKRERKQKRKIKSLQQTIAKQKALIRKLKRPRKK